MKTIWLALLLLLVGLVTMACIRFEIGFVVNDDGSGVINYQVAIKDDFAELGGEEIDFSEELGDLPPGVEIEEYSEDGFTGAVVTIPIADFSDTEEVKAAIDELGDPDEIPVLQPDTFSMSKDEDGGWQFSMRIPSSEDPEDLVGLDGSVVGVDEIASALLGDAWFRVRLKLPGELAEHNADRIEDGVLVWELDILATEPRQLTARSVPRGGFPIVPIVAGVAGGVVLVALVSLAYIRRRR